MLSIMAHEISYYTVEPKAAHTHTVIFLHGRDSDCKEFADELFESEASGPADQPRTLLDLFPHIRWVFPSAPVLMSERFGTEMSQWFDMWSVENPMERPELQHPGLQQSIERICGVIKEEEILVPRGRIFLAGISQGFATAIAVFFAYGSRNFAGLIGLCSWMPAALGADDDYERLEDTGNADVFLAHAADDDMVPIENGRELRDILMRRLHVEWREYKDGGHWVNEPQGVDDIVRFIRQRSHYSTSGGDRVPV
ncbi:lysophospholipase II [Xylaria nigripes]|nr:lysophospholipase II [Xylaria nigripes]